MTKMGLLFILDRRDGKPIYGVEERPIPKTDVPGEATWSTQPFPLKPAPLARNSFKREELAEPDARTSQVLRSLIRPRRRHAKRRALHGLHDEAFRGLSRYAWRRQLEPDVV